MSRKKRVKKESGLSGITTAAGLARKLGVHRATISRRAKKKGISESARIGHQIMLDGAKQAALRKGAPKGRPRKK